MLNSNHLEEIKTTAEEFFKKTTFDVEIELLPQRELTLPINIKTESPQILIGEGGQTLIDIQRLLKSILRKKIPEMFYIDLDVSGYKEKKTRYLKELAETSANSVVATQEEKTLFPMPAYERRIVHMALAERKDVVTESVGREPERSVIIKPCL